ncbi:MAG: hypothetical protein V4722_00810 [Bacteroidota bacterium]
MDIDQSEPSPKSGCANCGHLVIAQGGPTPLCQECREKFIKFPIPLWIKIFGGAIAVIFIFSMSNLPKSFSLAMHLEKGKKAEKANNYLTAQREFEIVIAKLPNNIEAQAHLMLAAFYNQDISTVAKISSGIVGKEIEDNDLFADLQNMLTKADDYVANDSLMALSEKYKSRDTIPDNELIPFLARNPEDVYAKANYASLLFNRSDYIASDSMLSSILLLKPDYMPAIVIKATIKRELNQMDSSFYYCDKALAINHENTYILSSKARTLLKQHKDGEALKLASTSYKMNEKDYYSLATMALVYHYNNKLKERDEMIKKAASDSVATSYMQYPLDVISGQQKFRN